MTQPSLERAPSGVARAATAAGEDAAENAVPAGQARAVLHSAETRRLYAGFCCKRRLARGRGRSWRWILAVGEMAVRQDGVF